MRRLTRATTVALMTIAAACSASDMPPTGLQQAGIVAGNVTATRVDGGIAVANGTERGVAYAVWNPNFLGLLRLCSDPGPSCVRLKPGERIVVPIDSVVGWDAQAAEAVVYWWHVLPKSGGGYESGEVGRVTVSMK